MSKSARSQFVIKSWDEKAYGEGPDLPKLLRGLRGDGTSALGHDAEYPFLLNYEVG